MLNVRINLNGDNPQTLKDQLAVAQYRVQDVIDALNKLTIHGRNYQTCSNPTDCYDEDRRALLTHMKALGALNTWIVDSWLAIDAQVPRKGD